MVDYVISLLKNIPLLVQFIIALFGTIIYLLYQLINNTTAFNNLILFFKRNTNNIKNHEIFNSKHMYNNHIANIRFSNDLKTNIFRIILKYKIESIIEHLKQFNKTVDKKTENIDVLMSDCINNIVVKYEDDIKNHLFKQYREDADDLYYIVYENGFKPYHHRNISYILEMLQSFINSNIKNETKILLFYNLITTAMNLAVLDCEKVFVELNGSLNKYNKKWHD